MSNAQRMANALVGELVRLVKLDVADTESVKAECARATAINGTCRTLIELGEFQASVERSNVSCGIIMGEPEPPRVPAYERVSLLNEHGEVESSMDEDRESHSYHLYQPANEEES